MTADHWPIADGYMVYRNAYDNQIYCVGKGPSATTVSIKNDVVSRGSSVLITGTVTDVSSGATRKVESGEFNFVPAVSDASMGQWMEYIYMQKPEPTNATGVPIHLTAIDPNGNLQDIGTATSNSLGNYAIAWTPPVPGLYTVTANFEGSNSYFWQQSRASFAVSETPVASPVTPVAPSPSQAPAPSSPNQTATYIAIAAVVVIIAVIAAALVLRRRK